MTTAAENLPELAATLDDEKLLELIGLRVDVDPKLEVLVAELELRYRARLLGIETAQSYVQVCADYMRTLTAPTVTGLLDPSESQSS